MSEPMTTNWQCEFCGEVANRYHTAAACREALVRQRDETRAECQFLEGRVHVEATLLEKAVEKIDRLAARVQELETERSRVLKIAETERDPYATLQIVNLLKGQYR